MSRQFLAHNREESVLVYPGVLLYQGVAPLCESVLSHQSHSGSKSPNRLCCHRSATCTSLQASITLSFRSSSPSTTPKQVSAFSTKPLVGVSNDTFQKSIR